MALDKQLLKKLLIDPINYTRQYSVDVTYPIRPYDDYVVTLYQRFLDGSELQIAEYILPQGQQILEQSKLRRVMVNTRKLINEAILTRKTISIYQLQKVCQDSHITKFLEEMSNGKATLADIIEREEDLSGYTPLFEVINFYVLAIGAAQGDPVWHDYFYNKYTKNMSTYEKLGDRE